MGTLKTFSIDGQDKQVKFVKTTQVKSGITCDVYSFANETEKDLAIVCTIG